MTTTIDKEVVREALREAAYHMAACWDALRQIEQETGLEVETEQIEGLASDCDCPANYPEVDDERLQDFLDAIQEGEGML